MPHRRAPTCAKWSALVPSARETRDRKMASPVVVRDCRRRCAALLSPPRAAGAEHSWHMHAPGEPVCAQGSVVLGPST